MAKVYNIIDSVKGGCGKTTFSIMLAEYLGRKSSEGKVCLFDMDFIGTGMWNLFYSDHSNGKNEEDEMKKIKEFKKEYIFINDVIRGFRTSGKKYVVDKKISGSDFHLAFGSPEYNVKKEYILAIKNNYSMAMKYGRFKAGLRDMLSEKRINEQLEGVKYIILDMAPCTDNNSEAIKEIIFDKSENEINDGENKVNYFLLLGMDTSQIHATHSYLRNFISTNDKLPDNIFVVFNDVSYCLYTKYNREIEEQYNARKDLFNDIKSYIGGKNKINIYFLVLNNFENYKKNLLEMIPLTDDKCNGIFVEIPFSHGGSLDDEIVELSISESQENVLKWIQGK